MNEGSQFVSPPKGVLSDIAEIKNFYSSGQLFYTIDRTHITVRESISLQYDYRKNGVPLALPEGSTLSIRALS